MCTDGKARKNGNTSQLLTAFLEEWEKAGEHCEPIWLYDKTIQPCRACRSCQKNWSVFGCAIRDDLQTIFEKILACDLLLLATPIYSWYCTPPMKAVLDRLVYGMNKFYGEEKGPALWAGKESGSADPLADIHREKGADLWEEGIRRYCKHSHLQYLRTPGGTRSGIASIPFGAKKRSCMPDSLRQILPQESCEMRLE